MSSTGANSTSGLSPRTMALLAIIGVPIVLILIIILVSQGRSGEKDTLPALQTKGLKWAEAEAQTAGFDNVHSHDALGRGRSSRDDKDWQVCFEVPAAGRYTRGTSVELAVVQVTEDCPRSDLGRINKATTTMPQLVERTALMAKTSLGANASVRFVDATSMDDVNHNLGDYRICAQTPVEGESFNGVPVTAVVIPYEDNCHSHRPPADDNGKGSVIHQVEQAIRLFIRTAAA